MAVDATQNDTRTQGGALGRGGGVNWKAEAATTPPRSLVSWRNTGGIVALLLNHGLTAIIPPGRRDGRSRHLRKLKSMAVLIRPPANEFRDNRPPTPPKKTVPCVACIALQDLAVGGAAIPMAPLARPPRASKRLNLWPRGWPRPSIPYSWPAAGSGGRANRSRREWPRDGRVEDGGDGLHKTFQTTRGALDKRCAFIFKKSRPAAAGVAIQVRSILPTGGS